MAMLFRLDLTKAELETARDVFGHALGLDVECPPEHLTWPLHTAFAEAVHGIELIERFEADGPAI